MAQRIESILDATKRACGIVESYDAFDSEILLNINAAFAVLHQLGAGPVEGFSVEDSQATWDDFVEPGPLQNMVFQYVTMSTHHDFDPPTNATVLSSMENRIAQLESRISYYVDPNPKSHREFYEEIPEEEEDDEPYDDPYWD
jgi:hypothetical protein